MIDFTTAKRMADAINESLGDTVATAFDDGMVRMAIPEAEEASAIAVLSQIELVELEVDSPARVVVNERTGTVVMGANVQVSAVAVAHGGLSIEVQQDTEVSQPGALSGGDTVVTRDSRIVAEEEEGRLTMLEGVTIGQLVAALNAMGVKPRDLIQIMLTIKAAGALASCVSVSIKPLTGADALTLHQMSEPASDSIRMSRTRWRRLRPSRPTWSR